MRSPPGAGLSPLLPDNLANGFSQGLSPRPRLCMDVAFVLLSQLALCRTLPWQFVCCVLPAPFLQTGFGEATLRAFTAPGNLFLEYHLLTPQLGLLYPCAPGERSKSLKAIGLY